MVADKPIRTFKVCTVEDTDTVMSYYYDQEYRTGETYTLNRDIKPVTVKYERGSVCFYNINKGFHSYSPDKIKMRHTRYGVIRAESTNRHILDYYDMKYKLVRVDCTIPKGTTYYENEDGEFVSHTITIDSITPMN